MFHNLPAAGWGLLQRSIERITEEYLFRSPLWAVALILAVLAALVLLHRAPARAAALADALRRRLDLLIAHETATVALLALGSAAASLAVGRLVLGHLPHCLDEITYLFTARTFASGHLTATAPPADIAHAFHMPFTIQDHGRWFGKYTPGWPAVLALGAAVGAPWLVNPLLNALSLVLVHRLLKEWCGPRRALVGVALMATAPDFIILGATYMSHTLALTLHALLLTAFTRVWRRPDELRGWALLGATTGALALARPMDGVALSAAPILAALAVRALSSEKPWQRLEAVALPALIALGMLFAYNTALLGHPFASTYARWSPLDRPGFAPDVGIGYPQGHNVIRAGLQLFLNLLVAGDDLFGWPLVGLVFALIGLAAPPRWSALERVGAASLALHCAGYATYHWLGIEYGPRYYAPLWPVFLLFTIGGMWEVARRLGDAGTGALAAGVALATMIAATTWWGPRLGELVDYRNLPSDVSIYLAQATGTDVMVVPAPIGDATDLFESLFNHNPIDLEAPRPLFVRDGDWVLDGRLTRAFPKRRVGRLVVTAYPHMRGTAQK